MKRLDRREWVKEKAEERAQLNYNMPYDKLPEALKLQCDIDANEDYEEMLMERADALLDMERTQ